MLYRNTFNSRNQKVGRTALSRKEKRVLPEFRIQLPPPRNYPLSALIIDTKALIRAYNKLVTRCRNLISLGHSRSLYSRSIKYKLNYHLRSSLSLYGDAICVCNNLLYYEEAVIYNTDEVDEEVNVELKPSEIIFIHIKADVTRILAYLSFLGDNKDLIEKYSDLEFTMKNKPISLKEMRSKSGFQLYLKSCIGKIEESGDNGI